MHMRMMRVYICTYLWFFWVLTDRLNVNEQVDGYRIKRILWSIIDTIDQKEQIFYQWIDTIGGLHDQ
jgi:hypothetical protein